MQNLDNLSNEDLTHLYKSMRDNSFDERANKIVQSLDDESLQNIYGSMSAQESQIKEERQREIEQAKSEAKKALKQSKSEVKTSPVKAIAAGAIGAAQGLAELPLGVASMIPGLQGVAQKGQQAIEQDPIYNEYPGSSRVGYGAGMLMGGKGISDLVKFAAKGAARTFPILSGLAGDTIKANTGREAISGGIIGSAMNPQHPLQGALAGSVLGGIGGAVGGTVGSSLSNRAKIVENELMQANKLGLNINDPQVLKILQKELDEGGVTSLLDTASKSAEKAVQGKISRMKPKGLADDLSPNEVLEGKVSQGYQAEKKALDDLEAPMRDPAVQVQVEPTNLNREFKSIRADIEKLKLPEAEKKALMKQLDGLETGADTFSVSEMLDYKRYISSVTSQEFKQIKQGARAKPGIDMMSRLQAAAEKDLAEISNKSGVPGAYEAYSKHYLEKVKPYEEIINKGETLKEINTLLNSNNPNMSSLNKLITSLGDEGKATVGWAIMQNAFNKSVADGTFKSGIFIKEINRYLDTGVGRKLLTPAHREVMKNLKDMGIAARQILKQGNISERIFIEKIINRGIFSKAFIENVIMPFGKASAKQKREIIQSILTTSTTSQFKIEEVGDQ